MLLFENIRKSFGNEIVLDQLNFHISKGQKVVLTGKSGGGKTTILNMVTGFEKADSGRIIAHNLVLNNHNVWEIRARTALLFQHPVFAETTVLENIIFPFSFKKNKHLKPSHKIILQHLDQTGLSHNILSKNSNELSGGQNQRIALIICKLMNRSLVLLDEPTSALDPESKNLIMNYFMQDKTTTILSVSHDDDWIKNCDTEISINGSQE